MLGYIMVLLIAAVVGIAVYLMVLRLGVDSGPPAEVGAPSDVGEWRETAPPPPAQPEGSFVPVAPSSPSWHSRVGGVMGLVIAVTVAALGIAFGLYLAGHMVAHLVHSGGG
jgi:hypothetical protein